MFDRRQFIASALGSAAFTALPTRAFAFRGAQGSLEAQFAVLAEQILRVNPTSATGRGLDTGARAALKSQIADGSPAGRFNVLSVFAKAQPTFAGFDADGLDPSSREQLQTIQWTTDVAARLVRNRYGGYGGFGYPVPYVVSQLTGAYQSVPNTLIDSHTIANATDAEAYVARLDGFARLVEQECDRIAGDAGMGVAPPDFILDKTIAQTRSLAEQRGDQSRLVQALVEKTAKAGVAGDWASRASAIVDGRLMRALARQSELLVALKAKPGGTGVSTLPDGARFYDDCLAWHTTTSLNAEAAHAVGLEQVAELSAQADALLKAQALTKGSVGARLMALGKDPQHLYPNTDAGRQQCLSDIRTRMTHLRGRMGEAFNRPPKSAMTVERVPVETELGAPGAYARSGRIDGSTPGTYFINLSDMNNWPKWSLATLTHHEGVPGHLLAGATVQEQSAGSAPLLFTLMGFSAYNEGWALYAEQLGDEIGEYADDPLGKIGYLQAFLWRAARIVVDTGLHAKGWGRQQAIDYMIDVTGQALGETEREIDRYIVWPGQATSYKLGHTEIARMREQAKAAMGARFVLKDFHDAVLLGGSAPLAVVESRVKGWTAGG